VSHIIADGDLIPVGNVELRVIETPGHCGGHCVFELRTQISRQVFLGDALFPLGQIALQPIPDCSVTESIASIELLRALEPDVLLPGHLGPVLSDGTRHIDLALDRVRHGRLPKQLFVPAR
jgi:glyoxylase-like metal-dependent hydrolase (beta-lactamase superfamily II)